MWPRRLRRCLDNHINREKFRLNEAVGQRGFTKKQLRYPRVHAFRSYLTLTYLTYISGNKKKGKKQLIFLYISLLFFFPVNKASNTCVWTRFGINNNPPLHYESRTRNHKELQRHNTYFYLCLGLLCSASHRTWYRKNSLEKSERFSVELIHNITDFNTIEKKFRDNNIDYGFLQSIWFHTQRIGVSNTSSLWSP